MSLLAVPTPSSPVTIASTGSSDDGFEDADENDATSSSPPLSTTVQLGEVDPSTQLVAEVPSPVPAEEDKVVIEEAEPLSPALTSPETPTEPRKTFSPALKSVTAYANAGSNPALASSGGDGSPSISGAVWRASGGAMLDVDLGDGNSWSSKGKGRESIAPVPKEEDEATGTETPDAATERRPPSAFQNLPKNDASVDWEFWGRVMSDYEAVAASNPRELSAAIQSGIPPALRGMTWQLMSASKDAELEATYKALLKMVSPHEKSIGRDLSRTFPRHDYFRDGGGGQMNLFNVVKAYSLYDEDVGYTQGLQFIVGPLLLNMPDEEAFCVLVRLMQSYDLRSHYTPNMPGLQLRLFQFDRLVEELLPSLFMHLLRQGVKSSMYGSQWFLTLYGYRFPLELVSVVFDLVFAEGVEAVFRFAVSILRKNEAALLELEFENLIEFLKNALFEAYAPDAEDPDGLYKADEFVKDALQVKISPSMLDEFGEEWATLCRAQTAHTAELETLRRANAQLSAQVRGLENSLAQINIEHCDLVRQVVESRLEREELEDELVKYKTAFADLSHRQAAEGARGSQRGSISISN